MSAASLQAFLRFLSQDAKVPLSTAMSKIKDLQTANLDSIDNIAKAKPADVNTIFSDEKLSKQIVSAAKRVSKKRAAGEDTDTSSRPAKKRKDESLFSLKSEQTAPAELETSLALPHSDAAPEDLAKALLFTNRAPLVLAFVVMLLKYTMPEQPLSSRLSLAQAYVSTTSRSRAVNLGIETGKSAEEEGFGEGQPLVTIMGKDLRVLRRWGYEWKVDHEVKAEQSAQETIKVESQEQAAEDGDGSRPEDSPALWALDLEALKKTDPKAASRAHLQTANTASMPIYTPQSARAYLLKSFDTVPPEQASGEGKPKKQTTAQKQAERERNLGMLLRAIDLLYESWVDTIGPEELDKRVWGWYVKVRPAVEHGVAGWGGKNVLKVADILALRREE